MLDIKVCLNSVCNEQGSKRMLGSIGMRFTTQGFHNPSLTVTEWQSRVINKRKGTMISKSKGDPNQSQKPSRGQHIENAQKIEIRG